MRSARFGKTPWSFMSLVITRRKLGTIPPTTLGSPSRTKQLDMSRRLPRESVFVSDWYCLKSAETDIKEFCEVVDQFLEILDYSSSG